MNELEQNIQIYLATLPIKQAFLFGSYARNEQTENSDIDILIDIDYSTSISLFDFIGWKLELEKITKKNIDLVANDAISSNLRPFIDNDKRMIYEKR